MRNHPIYFSYKKSNIPHTVIIIVTLLCIALGMLYITPVVSEIFAEILAITMVNEENWYVLLMILPLAVMIILFAILCFRFVQLIYAQASLTNENVQDQLYILDETVVRLPAVLRGSAIRGIPYQNIYRVELLPVQQWGECACILYHDQHNLSTKKIVLHPQNFQNDYVFHDFVYLLQQRLAISHNHVDGNMLFE